jgi:hypothetical protein
MRIEAYEPPALVLDQAVAIAQEAHLDLGGIEYLINERDGRVYFYDVNALSNFVTDAERIVGFNPYEKLVDFLACELARLAPSVESKRVAFRKPTKRA